MDTPLLARASFGFHELIRGATRLLLTLRSRNVSHEEATTWRTLSDSLEKPLFLPILSVIGPRWNCHGVIASLGPLQVERRLACRIDALHGRADSWSIVVYDELARTVAWAGSATCDGDEVSWQLPPGRYQLAMRFYSESDELVVPTVLVDDVDLACGRTISGAASRYQRDLQTIRNKSGAFYRGLHYYAFHHLRAAPRWGRGQFLPVGNPDTEWYYGHLERGERLRIAFDEEQNDAIITYVSFYNWASFPVEWCTVQTHRWLSKTFDEPLGYAIRRVRKRPPAAGEDLGPFEAKVIAPTSAAFIPATVRVLARGHERALECAHPPQPRT